MTDAAPTDLQHDSRVRFVLEFARALQLYGAAAHRLEDALESCCLSLGLEGQFFATPTSVFCAFGSLDDQRVRLLRVNAGEVDLGKLTELYELWGRVAAGRLPPADAAARVRGIVASRPPARRALVLACHAAASGSAACFFGGGGVDVLLAAALGLMVGVLALSQLRFASVRRVAGPAAAFLAAAVVTMIGTAHGFGRDLTIIASLIVLVPGFTLTIAISELAHGHLAAGTSRLMGAIMVFLSLTVGVALGVRVGGELLGVPLPQPLPQVLPWWATAAALLTASLCYVVLFHARLRDTGWIIATCALSFYGARLGSHALGADMGVFLGAFLVGGVSNALARGRGTPAAVTALPGIIVLVPGSLGLRSLASLLEGQTLVGVNTAFAVFMIACALVTGLLLANFLVPTRREL